MKQSESVAPHHVKATECYAQCICILPTASMLCAPMLSCIGAMQCCLHTSSALCNPMCVAVLGHAILEVARAKCNGVVCNIVHQ